MSRPQKQCIFCSNPANSKEHFWPGWMHDLLPKLPDPRHGRRLISEHPTTGRVEQVKSGRSGGVETLKIRVVCVPCNTKWMHDLEEEVRPFLTPLIKETPVALDFEQMAVIARWVALKCMVAEHAVSGNFLTPEADRLAFRTEGTIPDYFRIYLINHNMKNATGYVRHASCIALTGPTPDPPLFGAAKNIQTISFTLGGVLVHLNAARVKDYTIESHYQTVPINVWDHCRIWPFQHHEMVWPRRPLLDRHGVASVITAWETIRAESTIKGWGELPT